MSSGAIMAMIKEKEEELEEIKETKIVVDKVYESMDCITSKYVQAGELMKTAGDIGGVLFDEGKTQKKSIELKNITAKTEKVLTDLEKRIAVLEADIQKLYEEYQAALQRETEEARLAAQRNKRQKLTK